VEALGPLLLLTKKELQPPSEMVLSAFEQDVQGLTLFALQTERFIASSHC
jgi:hypothetical protein